MMTETALATLFANHTGKQSDKWSGYHSVYDKLFSPYRLKPIRLLEIGVQNGGSLEIWSRYFPDAVVLIGCDIEPACGLLRYEDPRIAIVVGDASSDAAHREVAKHSEIFDIVIDDGSHRSSDIIRSFCRYFPMLEPGGVFIAEDLHCSYWDEYEGGLYDPASAIAFFKKLVDLVHRAHWGAEVSTNDLLAPFIHRYGALELDFRQIESIEFVDSICIVRKCAAGASRIGLRQIRGVQCDVEPAVTILDGTELSPPDQTDNPYLLARTAIGEEQLEIGRVGELLAVAQRECERHLEECTKLKTQLNSLRGKSDTADRELRELHFSVQELRESLSWRLTTPFRDGLALLQSLGRWARYVLRLFHLGGGPVQTWRLLFKVLREDGLSGVRWRLRNALALARNDGSNNYREWVRRYDALDAHDRERMKCNIAGFNEHPLISVVMPVYNTPIELLDQAIRSVRAQIYPKWELCIADDASPNESVRQLLAQHAEQDERIKIIFRNQNGHISAASNSAVELASGEFVALMDHDDLLSEHALYWVVHAISEHPDAHLIYSDEDKISADGVRYDPYFKCEYNRELMLAQNMISHLGVYRRSMLLSLGGFRESFDGAQDYDLALRFLQSISPQQVVHIPRVLYHWRAIRGSAAYATGEKHYAADASRRAVQEHLRCVGVEAHVMSAPQAPTMNRVRYALPERPPMASILIPTRDSADLLAKCVESIQSRSSWENYEIIVIDNGSVEEETFRLFDGMRSNRVRVIRDDSPFNFSALNNLAAREAQGEVICLLNNDIEVITSDWLEEMLGFAMQPGVGCVGARLWYPDGRLQHGGVVVGLGGVAGHAHKYCSRSDPGYFKRALLHQGFSAVTGACLMVRKEIFAQVGGLDEELAVAFNDIDFCLRVRERGYRNVWTPYAEFVHHESLSRGSEDSPEKKVRFENEVRFMQKRWGKLLMADTAYSANLTLDREDFSLAWPPRVDLSGVSGS